MLTVFASTISVSEEVKEISRDKTKLQLDIKYEATTVELDEMITLKVLKEKTTGTFPEKIYADVIRFDGGWSSGKKLIGLKASIIELLLVEGRSNSFEINVYDEQGNKLECQPNQFNILQGIGGLDKMQILPYYIGIGKFFHTENKDLFKSIPNLEKNKPVKNGIVGILRDLKTRSTIRPGIANDKIRIPIYQGAYGADRTNPVLNNFVREIIITGEDLPALLPEGSDVEITIKVDSSQIMKFSVYFPLLNYTEELEVDIKDTRPPTQEELTMEISKAKRTAQKVNAKDVMDRLEALKLQLENEGGSADGKMKIQDGLRNELLKLDSAESTAEWPKVEQELKDAFFSIEDLFEKIKANGDVEDLNMNNIEANIEEYKKKIEYIIPEKNIKEAKELTEEIESIDREIRNSVTDGAIDVNRIKYHDREFNNLKWKDKNKARQFVNQGLQIIADGKTKSLRPVLIQIWDLRIDDEGVKDTLE